MLSSAVFAHKPAMAMEPEAFVLEVPESFPGHISRPISDTVKIPDHFDPADYQQNKCRNEGACGFNSMLAGIMHTEYGRSKVQAILKSQDDRYVNLQFYFPNYETVKEFEASYYTEEMLNIKDDIQYFQDELDAARLKDAQDEKEIQYLNKTITQLSNMLETQPLLWEKALRASQTVVKVPKNFVTREEKASFPHDNPEWLNLLQQAYMMTTKNKVLRSRAPSGHDSYSVGEKIEEKDVFWAVPFCNLNTKGYEIGGDVPKYLNLLGDPTDTSRKFLNFFPLLDIPLKEFQFYPDKAKGIDIENTVNLQIKVEGEKTTYTPVTYETITAFVHHHGLSKDLLMNGNVVQIQAAGHAAALFFGQGKVMYYDNVFYPHSSQISVYGKIGPIYEDAHHFEGLSINAMVEEDFFTRFFKEINYRNGQVAQVRGKGISFGITSNGVRANDKIIFFERPLAGQ
jgi:hypothetical protein